MVAAIPYKKFKVKQHESHQSHSMCWTIKAFSICRTGVRWLIKDTHLIKFVARKTRPVAEIFCQCWQEYCWYPLVQHSAGLEGELTTHHKYSYDFSEVERPSFLTCRYLGRVGESLWPPKLKSKATRQDSFRNFELLSMPQLCSRLNHFQHIITVTAKISKHHTLFLKSEFFTPFLNFTRHVQLCQVIPGEGCCWPHKATPPFSSSLTPFDWQPP